MIYLDHNATTPIDPKVFEAMSPYLTEKFGNPSSVYRAGQDVRNAIEDAREKLAGILGARPREVRGKCISPAAAPNPITPP